jgi:Arc/MetJ-type ribon-helix-helix transcriptional regulator
METMTISVSKEMKAFVEARTTAEGYASADDYLRALIVEAQRRQARRDLEEKLLEGLQGPAVEMTPEDWDSIEQEARERFAREQTRP